MIECYSYYVLLDATVLVIGDSHVRRMTPYHGRITQHLCGISVTFECTEGTGLHFAEEQVCEARGFDIKIMITGGNNIDNGMSPLQLADRLHHLANDLLSTNPGSPQYLVFFDP